MIEFTLLQHFVIEIQSSHAKSKTISLYDQNSVTIFGLIYLVDYKMRKAKRIITDSPQLDYISPWKHNDTSRGDHYFLLSKKQIIEEIILPAQQEIDMQKRAGLVKPENYSPSLKKTTRTVNITQSDSKQKYLRRSWIHEAHV